MSASALRTSGKTRTDTAAVGVSLHTSCLQHVVVRCMPADIEGLKHSLVWAPLFTQAAGCDASPAWAGASASSSVTMRQRTLPCRCRCPQAPSMGVSSDGADQDGWWPPGQRTRGPDWRPRRRRCAQTAVYGLRVGLSSLTIRCCSCGSQLSDGDEVPVYAYRTVVTSRPSRYSVSRATLMVTSRMVLLRQRRIGTHTAMCVVNDPDMTPVSRSANRDRVYFVCSQCVFSRPTSSTFEQHPFCRRLWTNRESHTRLSRSESCYTNLPAR